MAHDDLVYVGHMLDMAKKAVMFVESKTRQDFDNDELLRLALTHLIQNIGEAASQLSQKFRAKHPKLPWKAIIGMRHRVVHDYMNVDEDIVWSTVTEDLWPMIEALESLLPPESNAEG